MRNIQKLASIVQFNALRGQETLHPLITVLDQSKSKRVAPGLYLSELYIVFLKELKCGELKYGRSRYDYEEGTLVFMGPGQLMGIEPGPDAAPVQPSGWALAFHPDLIRGTSLGRQIKNYGFFSYDVNEALHLSERERQVVIECFKKIFYELEHAIDKHSKTLIVSNIELLLNYCVRFYDRQFITRDNAHKDALIRFEALLDDYFESDRPQRLGLPSVSYCAGELNLSPNYFGDLIKKETGHTAQEYIQEKLIHLAKEKLFHPGKQVNEIAFEMGFKYPQHFTRLFKQRVGKTPNEYRLLHSLN